MISKRQYEAMRSRAVAAEEDWQELERILCVVLLQLCEARKDLSKLAHAMYAGDDSKPILKLAHKVLKEHGWPEYEWPKVKSEELHA
jgi:hypothetical protein